MAKNDNAGGSLLAKMMKAAGKGAALMVDSELGEKLVLCKMRVAIVNAMLGGSVDSGLRSGITQLIGDSRTFKTNFCLMLVAAYLDTYPDAICIFLDNEFGAAQYFDTMGIDKRRVIHVPVTDVEDLKIKHTQMLESITKGDKVIFFLDSLSQIASLKESDDAAEGKTVTDMSRAKAINSYVRIITPRLTMKDVPFLVINNFYDDTANKYAEPIIKGGKQIFLSSDTILMVTRSQVKDEEKSLLGWDFNYTVMKSRWVQEKSKFTVNVLYDGGINQNSGLFEMALESGFIVIPTQGFYQIRLPGQEQEDKKFRKKEIEKNQAFFDALVKNKDFQDYVSNKYQLSAGEFFKAEEEVDVDQDTGEVKLSEVA